MNCAPFQELLSAELDGELSQAEQEQLQQHLAECPACRSLRLRLEHMESGFAQLPEAPPPSLRSKVATLPIPAKSTPAGPAGVLWAALLAAAACAALLSWPQQSPPAAHGVALYLAPHTLQVQPPPVSALAVSEFHSGPLHGRHLHNQKLGFELHLDSHQHVCKELHLEIEFDFDGDGKVDRREAYRPFNTDGEEGWEVYSEDGGPHSQEGEMRDFTGGTISAHLKNASGDVQVLSGSSKLVLPYRFVG